MNGNRWIAVIAAAVVAISATVPAMAADSVLTRQTETAVQTTTQIETMKMTVTASGAKVAKKAAKKAYKKFLSETNELWCKGHYTTDSGVRFCKIDLNKDGVPELLVETGLGYGLGDASATAVYAYVNGKVKYITSYNNKIGHAFYCNTAGGVEYYIDSSTIYYQKFNGKKMVTKAVCVISYTGTNTYYNAKSQTISGKKFNTIVSKLQKNAKKNVSYKTYKNNKKNRRKYL